jgi:hypothetical protein
MAKFAKDVYRYTDSQTNVVDKRIYKEMHEVNSIVMMVSASLDIYKFRFVRNLKYVLAYTGLSEPVYCRRMKSYGVKSTRSFLYNIENGKTLGFDLFMVAAFCHEFKLPIPLVLNFDIEDRGIDLADYGLFKDSHRTNKLKNFKYIRYMKEPHNRRVAKSVRERLFLQASKPKPIIDLWSVYNRAKG